MFYGLDGEGRWASAQHGTVKIVCDGSCSSASTTFNAAGQPLTMKIGGFSDNDTYTYDPNTGRMSTYKFTVGSSPKSMQGTLTWNTNGTLRQLTITDQFNAGGAQTCTYGTSTVMGYDDLGRLLNVNCGTKWSQTFSYDPFGNITKSGSLNWMPGYNQSTNRYNLAGTSYDSNGNLLNDSFHTYKWDANENLLSIDSSTCGTNGTCLTYDALGRVVEKNVGGVFTEVQYSQLGKTSVNSGRTPNMTYYPLPGGATEVANGSTKNFLHSDWIGSARLATTPVGRALTFDRAFAPFGEMYDNFSANDKLDFTGDTQDVVAGLYDTHNRELHPNQGRWISHDPAGLDSVDPDNPQSWNRYACVLNNPLAMIDPYGLWCVWEDGTHDDDPAKGGYNEHTCQAQGGHWDPFDTIAGIQQDGQGNITTIIYTNGVICTTSECGVGETLDAFDKGLQSYSLYDLNRPDWLETLWSNADLHVEFQTEPRITAKQWFRAAIDCAVSPDPLPKMRAAADTPHDSNDTLGQNSLNRSNTIRMPNKRGRAVAVSGQPSPGLDNGAAAAAMANDWGTCVQYELDHKYW
jgi:RHS repeat-associated protein